MSKQKPLIVMCVDGNVFLNCTHIVSQTSTKGFETASTLVDVLEKAVGDKKVEFTFN